MKSGLKRVIHMFEEWALALAVQFGWLRLIPAHANTASKSAQKVRDSRRRLGRRRG